MKTTTKAAVAAGAALLMLCLVDCEKINAQGISNDPGIYQQVPMQQQVLSQSELTQRTFRQPTTASASLQEAPQGPLLIDGRCGSIGPQVSVTPIFIPSKVENADSMQSAFLMLRSVSDHISQFKGKVKGNVLTLIDTLQISRRSPANENMRHVAAPTGYTLTGPSTTVSPAVF